MAAQPTIASRITRIEMSKVNRAADVWRGAGDVSRRLLVGIRDTMRIWLSRGRGRTLVSRRGAPSTWCFRSERVSTGNEPRSDCTLLGIA